MAPDTSLTLNGTGAPGATGGNVMACNWPPRQSATTTVFASTNAILPADSTGAPMAWDACRASASTIRRSAWTARAFLVDAPGCGEWGCGFMNGAPQRVESLSGRSDGA